MKTKTKGIIASVVATAILGSAVGLGTYSFAKTTKNNFGFKGTYSINALAEETTENKATASTVTVDGVSIDVTSTLTLPSVDKSYTLFVSIIDVDDFDALENVTLGYTVNGKVYNGQKDQLTNVVYSSLTVTTDADTGATSTLYAYELAEKYTSITTAKLVIAEVSSSNVGSSSATLTIQGTAIPTETNTYAYDSDGVTNADYTAPTAWTCATEGAPVVTILAGDAVDANSKNTQNVTIENNNKTPYSKRIKLNGVGTTEYRSIKIELTKRSSITVYGMSANSSQERSLVVLDTNGNNVSTVFATNESSNLVNGVVNLNSGTYYLATGEGATGGVNVYGINIGAPVKVTYTGVAEVPATCGEDGVAAHYTGSDGKLYNKVKGEYVETTEAELVIPATGEHTASETWTSDTNGHWHECSGCDTKVDYADHTDTDGDKVCDVCGSTISDFSTETFTVNAYKTGDILTKDTGIKLKSFTITPSKNFTVTAGKSTATADDDSGSTFANGILPTGNSDYFTITANYEVTLTVYFTVSDSKFATNDQSKTGNLSFTFDDSTTWTATKTDSKSNKVAYTETITVSQGQTFTMKASSNRLVLFAIVASYANPAS